MVEMGERIDFDILTSEVARAKVYRGGYSWSVVKRVSRDLKVLCFG